MSATEDEVKQLREIIQNLKKQNWNTVTPLAAPSQPQTPKITYSITDKKQVAINFGNFSCKLYKSQWLKILEYQHELLDFCKDI